MKPYNPGSTKPIITATITAVTLGLLALYYTKPTAGDHIDKYTADIIRNYLYQLDVCEDLAKKSIISPEELKTLRKLNKHYVSIYTNKVEVEQSLSCSSVELSKMLYFGWLIKQTNHKHKENIILENINIRLAQRSISSSVVNSERIPIETLEVLGKIEYFKKPSRLDKKLLENHKQE